jgi:hypothetical protein
MKKLTFFLCLLFALHNLQADKIFQDLDFSSGEWVMVGVPLHNYQLLPIQQELGTFICKDMSLLKEIQKNWDLEYTNEDNCDYHYTLKFYRNKEEMRSYTLNLYCGYITLEGLSYSFDPQLFDKVKKMAKSVDWSRINFSDEKALRKAITTLSKAPDVYWYEDVRPLEYKGFFMMGLRGLSWDTNMDSLAEATTKYIADKTGKKDFYVKENFFSLDGDMMYVSYEVNCNEDMTKHIQKIPTAVTDWKPHVNRGDTIRVVAIGVNETRYHKLMGM